MLYLIGKDNAVNVIGQIAWDRHGAGQYSADETNYIYVSKDLANIWVSEDSQLRDLVLTIEGCRIEVKETE